MEPGIAPGWRSTSASLKGSSHGPDSPNQDAVRVEEVADGAARTWIAAVADGHGGSRYVRSDVGSRSAVDVAVEVVAQLLASDSGDDPDLLRTAAPLIVEQWRARVLAHLASDPFSEDEATRGGALLGNAPVVAYGATLLIAVVDGAGVRLAQIGDGDALVRTHGYAVRPIPGDARLIANETTSLCLDSAASDFRFAELPSSAEVDLVLLASDGYGNSFAATDWWHTLVGDVAWYVDVHGFEEFSAHLPDWLAESALVGGDDVSAAVLSLPAEALPPPVAISTPARVGSRDVDAEPVPSAPVSGPRHGRRRGLVAAFVVGLIAVAAAAVGYVLMGGDAEPSPVTPTSISPSPSDSATPSPSDQPSPSPSKKGKNNTDPGRGRDSGPGDEDIEAPPNDVPDRPSDPKGTSKSDPDDG